MENKLGRFTCGLVRYEKQRIIAFMCNGGPRERERDENYGLLINPQVASGLLENSTVKDPTRFLEFSEAKERHVGE